MATYVTLKQETFGMNPWNKVLRVLPELGTGNEALVQIQSLNGEVGVIKMDQIDRIAKDGDLE